MVPQWLSADDQTVLAFSQSKALPVRALFSGCLFEYCDCIKQTTVAFSNRLAKIKRLGHVGISVTDVLSGAQARKAS